jgi:hypothetical protein
LTIPIGPEISGWTSSSDNANWSGIISLKYDFLWSENVNSTIRLDGLFFRGVFKSAVEIYGIQSVLLKYASVAFMQFVVIWVLLSGLLFIISKGLGGKALWKPILIMVGFILITLFLQTIISVVLGANLPSLYYTVEWLGGVGGEGQNALDRLLANTALASQVTSYVNILMMGWIIALCTLAIRQLTEFSWSKSALIATVAYFVTILVSDLIQGV